MSPNEDLSLLNPASKLPWFLFIEGEIQDTSIGPAAKRIGTAFRSLLLGENTAADTARRIDASYEEQLLSAHSMAINQDDEGMGGSLDYLWGLLCDIAMRVPYNDPSQNLLIQFIVELRKLPPKSSDVPEVDRLVYAKEPVFGVVLNDRWNANRSMRLLLPSSRAVLNRNLNCKGSGLATQYEYPCVHAGDDIEDGLEKDIPHELVRDCKIMVAAQYILLAGTVFSEELFGQGARSSAKEWGLKKWPIWSRRLKEIALEYEERGNTELAAMTRKAHEKMVSLSS